MSRSAVLYVNTKSRRGQEAFDQANLELRKQGIHINEARSFTNIEKLKIRTHQAVAEGLPLIVVGGGDGTFSAIARYFVDSNSTLGVLPLGTGNAFARDLGIGPDLVEACKTIANGQTQAVDLGWANDDYFLNVASVGLTTRVALALTDPMKKRWGRLVYTAALAKALVTVQPFHVKLDTNDDQMEFETLLVVIGNGRYHAGPFLLSPKASIVDGKLSLYALATTRKAAFLKFALGLVTGRQGELPEVTTMEPTSGKVETMPTKRITVDGEVSLRTPLNFRVVPGAIRVIVPQVLTVDGSLGK